MEIPDIVRMWLGSILRIGIGVYVGLCALLFFKQSGMVYYPVRKIAFTPLNVGLAYEDVLFTTPDGESIAAWHVPAEDARGTILMCHGNGGNNGDRIYAIEFFHGLGLNVFIFDYRGFGESTGRPSEEGTYKDAMAAWKHLTEVRRDPPDSIILHGRSLGGAIATWLAKHADRSPAGLVVEASFTSIPDIGRKLYPFLPVRILARYDYNTLRMIREVTCPVLVAHSRDDEMIPFAHGRKLFDAASEPKRFVELAGSHNDGESFFPKHYRRALDEFLFSSLEL